MQIGDSDVPLGREVSGVDCVKRVRVGDLVTAWHFDSKNRAARTYTGTVAEMWPAIGSARIVGGTTPRGKGQTVSLRYTVNHIPQSHELAEGLFMIFAEGGRVSVKSVSEARQKWEAFRDESGAGVSEIGNGVRVVNEHGDLVAKISYNGRVWDS